MKASSLPAPVLPPALAARRAWLVRGFQIYNQWLLRRNFNALRVLPQAHGAVWPHLSGPTVFFTNHPGWWDPLVLLHLAHLLAPQVPLFGPIAAQQLVRYPLLKPLGLFGVPQGPLGAAVFLKLASAALTLAKGQLWLTAQGAFADPRQRPAGLKAGLALLPAKVPGVQLVPVALEYPFGSEPKPDIRVAFGAPLHWPANTSHTTILAACEAALTNLQDQLAAAVVANQGFVTVWRRRAAGQGHIE